MRYLLENVYCQQIRNNSIINLICMLYRIVQGFYHLNSTNKFNFNQNVIFKSIISLKWINTTGIEEEASKVWREGQRSVRLGKYKLITTTLLLSLQIYWLVYCQNNMYHYVINSLIVNPTDPKSWYLSITDMHHDFPNLPAYIHTTEII